MPGQILVNDDEVAIVQALKVLLAREGYETVATQTAEQALDALQNKRFNLLITDIVMSPMSGLDLLARAVELQPTMPVILITGHDTVEMAVEAMRLGAFDLIAKPFRIKNLMVAVQRALTYESATSTASHSGDTLHIPVHEGGLVGECPGMQSMYRMIQNLAPTDDTLFIWGEAGTEVEAVAQAIHETSARSAGPLISLPCGDLAPDELEQKLFGHGDIFHQAAGGTVFLKDLLDLSPHLQHLLPHYLRKLAPSQQGTGLDVRLIVSAADPLDEAVVDGRLDRPLYEELNPLVITIPPLRERTEDLPLLCRHLLNARKDESGGYVSLSPASLRVLESYPWPENTAELKRLIGRAAKRCRDQTIRAMDLPAPLAGSQPQADPETDLDRGIEDLRWRALTELLRGKEADYLPLLLEKLDGDQDRAAKLLGITSAELTTRLEALQRV